MPQPSRRKWTAPAPVVVPSTLNAEWMGFSLGSTYRPSAITMDLFTAHVAKMKDAGAKNIRTFAGATEWDAQKHETTLNGAITGSPATFTVTSGTNLPTGAHGPFVINIAQGTGTMERILCSSRTGNVITIQTRGYAVSTSQDHASGVAVSDCGMNRVREQFEICRAAGIKVIHSSGGSLPGLRAPVGTAPDQNFTPWSSTGTTDTGMNAQAYLNFMADFAAEFKRDDDSGWRRFVIFWNEANAPGGGYTFWNTTEQRPDWVKYARGAGKFADAVRAVSVNCKVGPTNTTPQSQNHTTANPNWAPSTFLSYCDWSKFQVCCHDGYYGHPNTYGGAFSDATILRNDDYAGLVGNIRLIKAMLVAKGWTGEIHNIETGGFTANVSVTGDSGVTEAQQAAHLTTAWGWWLDPDRATVPDANGISLGVILNYGFGSYSAATKEGSFGVYKEATNSGAQKALSDPKAAYTSFQTLAAKKKLT